MPNSQNTTPAPGSHLTNAIPAMRDGRLTINLIDHIMVTEAAMPLHNVPRDCYGITQTHWENLCQAAFENLPTNANVTFNDIDSILTWCIPLYLDIRGLDVP